MGGTTPVVVIGNGPVGQTTALLLARWGLPVVLLDSRSHRELVGSRAICQQRDVLDIWDHVGAGSRIAEEGVTWTRARTFFRGSELFCQEFQDTGVSPFPPFVNISQCRTEQLLDEQVARQPLIDVRWGHTVVGIDQDATGVQVSCETVAGAVDVAGSFAVACGGARGDRLRRILGLSFGGHSFGDQFLICDLRTHLPGWASERRFYFDPEWNPGRQVLIHPCPDSSFRIDWQVPEGFDLAEEERTGALDRRIRQVIGDRDYEVIWKSVYRFHSRLVDRMRVGRVLVAGDGAHLVAPFGARGLNAGVMDAENAAWKIAFVARGWAGDGLLESYHNERHAAAAENLAVTGATMRFLVPQSEAEWAWRRDVLERAAGDPEARAAVDSGRLAEPFWYVDSPLTTTDPDRPFTGRPAKGAVPTPAPGILAPDHPLSVPVQGHSRLRPLLREGLTLLCGDDVEPPGASTITAPLASYRLGELSPALPGVFGARPDEAWLLRPDAHVAAVLHDPRPADLTRCLDRLLCREGAFDVSGVDTRKVVT
ncbi:MAG TPA: FAD-dependent monooxygenase [Marmoricola sp.]|nr:FAD-dependent monooxygenase [Marmoricola sp.]